MIRCDSIKSQELPSKCSKTLSHLLVAKKFLRRFRTPSDHTNYIVTYVMTYMKSKSIPSMNSPRTIARLAGLVLCLLPVYVCAQTPPISRILALGTTNRASYMKFIELQDFDTQLAKSKSLGLVLVPMLDGSTVAVESGVIDSEYNNFEILECIEKLSKKSDLQLGDLPANAQHELRHILSSYNGDSFAPGSLNKLPVALRIGGSVQYEFGGKQISLGVSNPLSTAVSSRLDAGALALPARQSDGRKAAMPSESTPDLVSLFARHADLIRPNEMVRIWTAIAEESKKREAAFAGKAARLFSQLDPSIFDQMDAIQQDQSLSHQALLLDKFQENPNVYGVSESEAARFSANASLHSLTRNLYITCSVQYNGSPLLITVKVLGYSNSK